MQNKIIYKNNNKESLNFLPILFKYALRLLKSFKLLNIIVHRE